VIKRREGRERVGEGKGRERGREVDFPTYSILL